MTTINTTKVAGFMGDFRTIWLGVLVFFSVAAWAGDTRWMTVADAEKIPILIKLDDYSEAIEEATFKLPYIKDLDKIKELKGMIQYKKEKREALIKKHNLQGK